MSDALCIVCSARNLDDYPACRACSPAAHFTNRQTDDCRCGACVRRRRERLDMQTLVKYAETLQMALADEPVLQEAAKQTIRYFERKALALRADNYCEPCFSSACDHLQAVTL